MNTTIIKENERAKAYPKMFGSSIYRGLPLYNYAENLFYNGLTQFVSEYDGGFFDFIQIIANDNISEIHEKGFIPLLDSDNLVTLCSPFGVTQKLSEKAACLFVWVIVVEQIANANPVISDRLYKVIQDIKFTYYDLLNTKGCKIFSKDDCTALYRLFD